MIKGKLHPRVWRRLAALLLSAAGGVAVGYVVGVFVTLNVAQHLLYRYASEHIADFERTPDEAHAMLSRMNASPYEPCSEAELTSFRRLLLASHFLKDLGRMQGAQLRCSAALSRSDLPQTSYLPDLPATGGGALYLNMDAMRVGALVPIVLRSGDAYAVMDPYNRVSLPDGVTFTLTAQRTPASGSNYIGGKHSALPLDILTRSNDGRVGQKIYATRCSARYSLCVTLLLSIADAARGQRRQILLWTGAGGMTGAAFGVVLMVLHRRKKGIEQQLRRAIRQGALRVVYQPLFDLRSRMLVGAEALVRWTDEDGLKIPPDVFIKVAEQRGFVDGITRLVARRVVEDFGRQLRERPGFHINMNVAASDLTDAGFPKMLRQTLEEARVPAASLGIEITEGATAGHAVAIEAVAGLRQRGHRVYIDDFGTGYSSLAYLKDLAVHAIKIDKAFTRAIGTEWTESVTVGILPQILAMAEALKLEVVAEGIETEAQAAYYAATANPIVAQGWLYGMPVPAAEFKQMWLGVQADEEAEQRLWAPEQTGGRAGAGRGKAAMLDALGREA